MRIEKRRTINGNGEKRVSTKLTSFFLSILIAVTANIITAPAFADTDGSEIQITDKPDVLILQLGPDWAGVEFELKTDAGIFPAPVVVDYSGILKMDLGGSKTYTLSCITSPVSVPNPEVGRSPEQTDKMQKTSESAASMYTSQAVTTYDSAYLASVTSATDETASASVESSEQAEPRSGISTGTLVLFILGFSAATGGLIAMRFFKCRREAEYDDDAEGDEDYG
jgi:hypothetical protein